MAFGKVESAGPAAAAAVSSSIPPISSLRGTGRGTIPFPIDDNGPRGNGCRSTPPGVVDTRAKSTEVRSPST